MSNADWVDTGHTMTPSVGLQDPQKIEARYDETGRCVEVRPYPLAGHPFMWDRDPDTKELLVTSHTTAA